MEELRDKILNHLYKGEYVSGRELASLFKVSRTAIWKGVNSLRELGYVIDSLPKKGYLLKAPPDLLLPYEIRRGLKARLLGRRIEHYDQVSSTNDIAKELAEKGVPEGTVVIAETQTTGKGRLGREWFSPEGGVWLSVVLRPGVSPDEVPRVALLLGVAVARTLSAFGVDSKLKWPNDVLVGGKKVCGILTEMDAELERVNFVIAGIGINVNNKVEDFPEEFRKSATSLVTEQGKEVPRAALVRLLLEELEEAYGLFTRGNFQAVLGEWRSLSGTLGRKVKIITHGKTLTGVAVDVDEEGALLLTLKDGSPARVLSGDCIHLQ